MRGTLLLTVLLLLPLAVDVAPAFADDEPRAEVTVPDVRRRRLEDAMRVLEAAGLKVGTIYEFSRERVLRMFKVRGVLGTVFLQKPTPGTGWSPADPVDLVVVAAKDGKLPPELVGGKPTPAQATPSQDTPAQDIPGKDTPGKDTPAKDAPGERLPAVPPHGGPRDDPIPPMPPPAEGDAAPPAAAVPRADAPPRAEGSPDAPRKAAEPDPRVVPELVGLDLTEAEMLVRDAQMKLHVERAPGHPVGKVLEQAPAGGTPRPAGGMIKVVITAGGDFESRMPGPPAVYVDTIGLPSLLDRTKAQAERIVVALGLEVQFEEAERGLAGRVVDQKPAAGSKVAKGGLVRLWIGPGAKDDADCDVPPPPGPIRPARGDGAKEAAPDKGGASKTEGSKGGTPTSQPPLEPGPLKGGIPQLVSPGTNTQIPPGAKVPVGFTWKGVRGANAYILEVEEMGAEGRWLPLARKPARTTAVLMDVERLDPDGASRLRWRVTAVLGGRPGTPSKWVILK